MACFALQELGVALIHKGKLDGLSVLTMAVFGQGETNFCGLKQFVGTIRHCCLVARMDEKGSIISFVDRFGSRFPAREYIPPFVSVVLNGKDAEKSAVPENFAEISLVKTRVPGVVFWFRKCRHSSCCSCLRCVDRGLR